MISSVCESYFVVSTSWLVRFDVVRSYGCGGVLSWLDLDFIGASTSGIAFNPDATLFEELDFDRPLDGRELDFISVSGDRSSFNSLFFVFDPDASLFDLEPLDLLGAFDRLASLISMFFAFDPDASLFNESDLERPLGGRELDLVGISDRISLLNSAVITLDPDASLFEELDFE